MKNSKLKSILNEHSFVTEELDAKKLSLALCNTLNACLYAYIDWIGLHIDYLLCDANDRFKSKSPNASLECGLLPQFNLLFIATAYNNIMSSVHKSCVAIEKHTRIIVGSHSNGNATAPDWNVSFWNLNAIRWVVIWLQHGSSSELFRLAAAVSAATVVFYWAVPSVYSDLIRSDRIEAVIFVENKFWLRNDNVDDWSLRMQHVPNISHHKRI